MSRIVFTGRPPSARRWHYATPSAICAIGLFTCMAASSEAGLAAHDRPASTSQRNAGSLPLVIGVPAVRAVADGESDSYSLDLAAGEYLTISIRPESVTVFARLRAPDGRIIAETSHTQAGERNVTAITTLAGSHRLEIEALGPASSAGRYSVTIVEAHRAGRRDRIRVQAWQHFTEAERLWSVGRRAEALKAIQGFNRALDCWKEAGDDVGASAAALRLGAAYHALREPEAALAPLQESLTLARRGDNPAAECSALASAARVHLDLGRAEDASREIEGALALSRQHGNRLGESEALNVLGDVYYVSGRIPEAMTVFEEALALSTALGALALQAQAMLNLGQCRVDLARISDAQALYGTALALWRAIGDRRGEGATLVALGHLHVQLGENQRAFDKYEQARAVAGELGDLISLARIQNGLGAVHLDLGEPQAAVDAFRRSAELYQQAKYAGGEGYALMFLGGALSAMGQNTAALATFSKVRSLARSVSDRRLEVRALQGLGNAHLGAGELGQALDEYRQSRRLAEGIADRIGEVYALNGTGTVWLQTGQYERATATFEEALGIGEAVKDRLAQSWALYNLARVDNILARSDDALHKIRASLELVEGLRSDVASLDLRASYLASVRDRYELQIDILMRLAEDETGEAGRHLARAFETSEQARARSFLDGLAESRGDIREGVQPGLLERERALRNSLNAKAFRLTQTRSGSASAEQIADLEREVDNLTTEFRDVEAQIRSESPRYAALVQPKPLGADEIRASVVDRDSVLLQYFLGKERSYVWAVTPDSVTGHTLPGRDEIEQRVRAFRDALTAPATTGRAPVASGLAADVHALERALSATLLDPIAPQLNRPRVLIVADGILQALPFSTLTLPSHMDLDANARVPLIVEHEIVYLPSASTLALIRGAWKQEKRWPKSVRVFADPVFEADDPRLSSMPARMATSGPAPGEPSTPDGRKDAAERRNDPLKVALRDVGGFGASGIPRLLEARREARSIAAIAPGADVALDFDASLAAARDPGLAEYRVIHFATHGLVDDRHPELSGVVLSLFDSKGEAADGFLRLNDIYNLHLPVDLVVLSACSTALGKEIVGEGLIGLVRGFMYAGSRRVLASLWKVDDEATSELMTRFYRGLLEKNLSPPAALRAAQLEMLGTKRWSHPFYWAGFVLQGEWN